MPVVVAAVVVLDLDFNLDFLTFVVVDGVVVVVDVDVVVDVVVGAFVVVGAEEE